MHLFGPLMKLFITQSTHLLPAGESVALFQQSSTVFKRPKLNYYYLTNNNNRQFFVLRYFCSQVHFLRYILNDTDFKVIIKR